MLYEGAYLLTICIYSQDLQFGKLNEIILYRSLILCNDFY